MENKFFENAKKVQTFGNVKYQLHWGWN